MSYLTHMFVGKHEYIYEVTGYRNENGKPRNKKHPVGKVDPVTGEEIFKPEFYPKLAQYGKQAPAAPDIQAKKAFTKNEIRSSAVREYGAVYFLESIAEQIGLKEILSRAAGTQSREILTLAEYLVCSEDPFMYCAHWIEGTETKEDMDLSSQRISDFFHEISARTRMDFFRMWAEYRQEREYLALDITSISSWSFLIEDVEWGYNRDGENLEQINLCLLMGQESWLPVFATEYSGSLKDVTTLRTTVKEAACYAKGKKLLFVMDKGFYSAENVTILLKSQEKYGFVIPVSFTAAFAKEYIKNERSGIDTPENTLPTGKSSIRAVSRRMEWSSGNMLNVHIFFNALKAASQKEEVYAHVSGLCALAKKDPGNKKMQSEYEKYLIRKETKTGPVFTINHKVVEKELETAGWLILLSNRKKSAKSALECYRAKDVVEKGFFRLKNAVDMRRIRVHSQESMQNKIFIGFVALILLSHINKVMVQKNMYRKKTLKEVVLTMKKLRVQTISGEKILFPVTAEQRRILDSFDIKLPSLS